MTLLYIDLDNFKYYNDTFGHDIGDLILKKIANLLKEAAGNDGFAVRFGGDEFLIILKSTENNIGSAVAKKVLDSILSHKGYAEEISSFLGRPVTIPENKTVSASIGVAVSPNVVGIEDINEALKRADSTLYQIKHTTKSDFMVAE